MDREKNSNHGSNPPDYIWEIRPEKFYTSSLNPFTCNAPIPLGPFFNLILKDSIINNR